ncbi:MAG: hypothetical protein KAI41_06980 [Hyphomicrobiaceae bacterium]|nr:hypothetical protein [Hyphomicrobiaceae bacterium]
MAAQERDAYYRRQNVKQRRAVVGWLADTVPDLTGKLFGVLNVGGANYAIGDEGTVSGGTFTIQATYRVLAVLAGAVTSVAIVERGAYTVNPGVAAATVATTGIGTGLTIDTTLGTIFTGQVFKGTRAKAGVTGIEARKRNGLGVLQLRVAGVNVGAIATGPGFTALGNVAANALVEVSVTTGFVGVEYVELRDGRGNPMGRGVINSR